jgi:hypothetical protein
LQGTTETGIWLTYVGEMRNAYKILAGFDKIGQEDKAWFICLRLGSVAKSFEQGTSY